MKLQHLTWLAAAMAATCVPALADNWNAPQEPFALFGNTYYVGTHGVSAVLITSPAGHILIDGGSPESPAQIVQHIRKLGFKIEDVKTILNSHEHADHAGGIAELKRLSGATVRTSTIGAAVLRTGRNNPDDPQFTDLSAVAPVARVAAIADGAVVAVGPLRVTAHYTPGHAPGGVSWTWQAREGAVTANMVYADSLSAYPAKPYTFQSHPAMRGALTRSIATVAALPCDIVVSAHPEASDLWERLDKAATQGHAGFIDRNACRAYAASAGSRLARVLAEEGASSAVWRTSEQLDRLFQQKGVTGTFLVHDVSTNIYTVHDRARAETRFVPASTFKIPNSLIGLSTGTVADVDTILPYGGKPTARPEWAHDMSLRDAIKISNVPVYQGMARRIGLPAMQENLRKLDYGNMDPGTEVDTFWLKGPLTISALEQTRFLERLAQDQLPFPKAAMAAVRDITRQAGTADLHAKTGWGSGPVKAIDLGWWVGWVNQDGKLYTFALNVDIPDGAPDQRVALGKEALKTLGLLPE